MNWKKIILSTFIIALILFVFGIVSQAFPWGVPTAQVVASSTEVPDLFVSNAKIQKLEVHELTTPKFDTQFKGKISTFMTDETFSWIISTDVENWQPMNYFMREMRNLLLIAFCLSVLLAMSVDWSNQKRLLLIFLVALVGSIATYGSQMNWWHVPPAFHVGLMVNLIGSWLLATWVSMRFVLKSN